MRAALVVLASLLAGCLEPGGQRCADGRLCPRDTICDDVHDACIVEGQLVECMNQPQGGPCDHPDGPGVCREGVCLPASCGDGIITTPEVCDGVDLGEATDCETLGYHEPGVLGCSDTCEYDTSACGGICGDGVTDAPYEQCDVEDLAGVDDCLDLAFYEAGPVGCTALCRYDVSACSGFCGDGTINGPEICEGEWTRPEQCIDFGYDAGRLDCAETLCGASFADCAFLGWRPHEYPIAADFGDLWGRAGDDVWAVASSAVAHYDGIEWSLAYQPAFFAHAITGWGTDRGWVVGRDGSIVRRDGTTWTPETSPTSTELIAAWAVSADEVWALGSPGVFHRTSSGWAAATGAPSGELHAIWASAPDDVWAVGAGGTIAHYDGTWQTVASPTSESLFGIWGTGPDEIWAVGYTGTLLHYDGASWTPLVAPTGENLFHVWASGRDDLWIYEASLFGGRRILHHHDGVAWTSMPAPTEVRDLWGTGRGDLWATSRAAYHWTGAGWGRVDAEPSEWNLSIGGTARDDVWQGRLNTGLNAGALWRFDGDAWTWMLDERVDALWPVSRGEVWFAGESRFLRFDGTGFTVDGSFIAPIVDMWGSGPDDVWAIARDQEGGLYQVLRYDGLGWSLSSEVPASAVWGWGPDDVWVTGDSGLIARWDGAAWTDHSVAGGPRLQAVWGSGPDDVWFVGVGGAMFHWDGAGIAPVDHGQTAEQLTDIWGTAADDVWAVSAFNELIHLEGTAWSRVRGPLASSWTMIWGSPRGLHLSDPESGQTFVLDRARPWTCRAAELGCGDAVDDDCDDLTDGQDPDCGDTVRLAEVFTGTNGFVEVTNRTAATVNLTGLELAWRFACDAAPETYTFPVDALVPAGARFRVYEGRDVAARERWLGAPLCDGTTGGGWVTLCAGRCDLDTCGNVIDVLQVGTPPGPPACAGFAPAPVDVAGAGPGDAVVRTAFTGTGAAGDWTIATKTRD